MGNHQIKGYVIAARIAPIKIKGRRRPQRERVLSEIQPMTGSAMPSHRRSAIRMTATLVGDIWSSILKTG